MSVLKRLALRTLAIPGATRPFRSLLGGHGSILMLHRFQHPDRGVSGHDPEFLRATLARLRRDRYELIPLDDLIRRLAGDGAPVRGAVAFTIDDGYADHAEVAAPVFAQFDCPVTTFVVSGFLDGKLWLWWDQVEFIFEHTTRREVTIDLGAAVQQYAWVNGQSRRQVQEDLIHRLKLVPDEIKHFAIAALATALDVDLPGEPPSRYAPMTWDLLRASERGGMRFGPHTVTHPVLARTSDAQARREIEGSWRRLSEESGNPMPVFCYPNGGWADFSQRETAHLAELGFVGAVVGVTGYAEAAGLGEGDRRFRVLRFPFPDDLPEVLQYVSGFERAKQLARAALGRT